MAGPKLFFDGAGWAFSFNMGVAQYLMRHYDLRRSPLYSPLSARLSPLITRRAASLRGVADTVGLSLSDGSVSVLKGSGPFGPEMNLATGATELVRSK